MAEDHPTPGMAAPDDRDREEVMEYRLTERAYASLTKRFEFHVTIVRLALTIVSIALAIVGIVGTGFGIWIGHQATDIKALVETRKGEIMKYADETAREMRIHRIEIMDAMVAQRAGVNFEELDRRARLNRPCLALPTLAQVESWIRSHKDVGLIDERGVDIVVGFVRRYNICDLEELNLVLADRRIQGDLKDLYHRILDRDPDLAGLSTWGWRLGHGYPKEVVGRMIEYSDEARQRGKGR
jgi:hypothetical protein